MGKTANGRLVQGGGKGIDCYTQCYHQRSVNDPIDPQRSVVTVRSDFKLSISHQITKQGHLLRANWSEEIRRVKSAATHRVDVCCW
jgi:hypothetical protein